MNYKRYITYLTRDFAVLYGAVMAGTALFMKLNSVETLQLIYLQQAFLISLALTLFKFGFVNSYDIPERAQKFCWFICTTAADLTLLIFLMFFRPWEVHTLPQFLGFAVIILLVKAMVFYMLLVNGREEARQLNEMLDVYKKNPQ